MCVCLSVCVYVSMCVVGRYEGKLRIQCFSRLMFSRNKSYKPGHLQPLNKTSPCSSLPRMSAFFVFFASSILSKDYDLFSFWTVRFEFVNTPP